MQKGVVTINDVPTYVATWGAWIEDDLKHCKDIVICVTGNPGVTSYYYHFLETLYGELNIPVWILSQAGHEVGRDVNMPTLRANSHLYTLEGQIKHKIEFLKKYVPRHVNIYFIGHSIGCHMLLRVLKDYPSINAQVKKVYLLFPTIQNMKESPNGQLFTKFIKYLIPLVIFFSWIFTLLPPVIKRALLLIYFSIRKTSQDMIRPTTKLINPTALKNVFFLAMEELELVNEPDHETIQKEAEKLFFCYGTADGWTPLCYYEDLKKYHPDIKAITCNYDHAFVLKFSDEVALCVCKWINSYKSNMYITNSALAC